jgi:hypothetical protein
MPVSVDELDSKEFGENDVLNVAPEEAAGDPNTVPQSIGLSLAFYQYN